MRSRWREAARSGFVEIGYIASAAVILVGIALSVIGHVFPYPYAPLAIYGYAFISGGVALAFVNGTRGTHPIAAIVIGLVIFVLLLTFEYYNLFGAQSWGA